MKRVDDMEGGREVETAWWKDVKRDGVAVA